MTDPRVILAGGTGLIGRALAVGLLETGYEPVILARDVVAAQKAMPRIHHFVRWDSQGEWKAAVDGAHAVINLAGAPIAGWPVVGPRWSTKYKKILRDSRIQTTRDLIDAIDRAKQRPAVYLGGSAIGYYGFHKDEQLTEASPAGKDFLARLVVDWEAEALKARELGVRVALLRTGIVLDRRGGTLPILALPFQLFTGGPVLPGSQYISWIHIDDEVGLIIKALQDDRVDGPINLTAPEPQTNRNFGKTLGKVLRRPSFLPVPGFALRILQGEAAQIVTNGQRVMPAKAEELGYQFRHPTLEGALRQLYNKVPRPVAHAATHS